MWIKEDFNNTFFGITITVTLEDLYPGSSTHKVTLTYAWNETGVMSNYSYIFTKGDLGATIFYNSLCNFLRDKYSKFTPSEEPEE